jgi:hypothetical protein
MASISIGLRAKTGRAIAVVLGGTGNVPEVLGREQLELADPSIRATGQPYHEVMHLAWPEAEDAVRRSVDAIQEIAVRSLAHLLEFIRGQGAGVMGMGIVGSSERDLSRIGNHHIRAHAAEGILFRRVLETASIRLGVPYRSFEDKRLFERAAEELGLPVAEMELALTQLGCRKVRPWRADEKAAAAAAWMIRGSSENGDRLRCPRSF